MKTSEAERQPENLIFKELEAARYIGMSRTFLARGRMTGPRKSGCAPPPHIKAGRAIRYMKSDLDDWLAHHRVTYK